MHLVINGLGGGHTDTDIPQKSDFRKPGVLQSRHTPSKSSWIAKTMNTLHA